MSLLHRLYCGGVADAPENEWICWQRGSAIALTMWMVPTPAAVGLFSTDHIVELGLGTVLSVLFVGRVMAVFNHLFQDSLRRLAGLEMTEGEKT